MKKFAAWVLAKIAGWQQRRRDREVMRAAEEFMEQYRNTLRELAKK